MASESVKISHERIIPLVSSPGIVHDTNNSSIPPTAMVPEYRAESLLITAANPEMFHGAGVKQLKTADCFFVLSCL